MGLLTGVQNRKLVWKCSFKVCHPNFFFLIICIFNKVREMTADYVTCSLYDIRGTVLWQRFNPSIGYFLSTRLALRLDGRSVGLVVPRWWTLMTVLIPLTLPLVGLVAIKLAADVTAVNSRPSQDELLSLCCKSLNCHSATFILAGKHFTAEENRAPACQVSLTWFLHTEYIKSL